MPTDLTDNKSFELTEGMFDEFLATKGVAPDRGCPRCGNKELWNLSGRDKSKVLDTYPLELMSDDENPFAHSVHVECANCGYMEMNYMVPVVNYWVKKLNGSTD